MRIVELKVQIHRDEEDTVEGDRYAELVKEILYVWADLTTTVDFVSDTWDPPPRRRLGKRHSPFSELDE